MSNASTTTFYPRLRRAWAERRAHRSGTIGRRDLMAAFDISHAQASADLTELQREHPGCLAYDLRAKTYRWADARRTPKIPIPHPIASFIF